MAKPDPAFGKDPVSFADVVDYVRSLEPSALQFSDFSDIIQILAYMRDEQLRINDKLHVLGAKLDERDADLTKREKEVAIRKGAVDMVLKGREQPRSYFWK